MKREPCIELDTPLLPELVASAVWDEAQVWLGEPLPRRWIRELTAHANTIYAHNERFRRRIRGPGDTGRDYLWMFMRHWLAAILARHRPQLHARMPAAYNAGVELPEKPPLATVPPVVPSCSRRQRVGRLRRPKRSAPGASWRDELHVRLLAGF